MGLFLGIMLVWCFLPVTCLALPTNVMCLDIVGKLAGYFGRLLKPTSIMGALGRPVTPFGLPVTMGRVGGFSNPD